MHGWTRLIALDRFGRVHRIPDGGSWLSDHSWHRDTAFAKNGVRCINLSLFKLRRVMSVLLRGMPVETWPCSATSYEGGERNRLRALRRGVLRRREMTWPRKDSLGYRRAIDIA